MADKNRERNGCLVVLTEPCESSARSKYICSLFMSPIVLSAVGLTCKAFLNSGLATITVNGLPILMDALHDDKRNNGHGIVTGKSMYAFLYSGH